MKNVRVHVASVLADSSNTTGAVALDFAADSAAVTRDGDNLLFTLENGGTVTLDGYFAAVENDIPALQLQDGTVVAGKDLLASLNSDLDLSTAAGESAPPSSGLSEFEGGGDLLGGVDRLGYLTNSGYENAAQTGEEPVIVASAETGPGSDDGLTPPPVLEKPVLPAPPMPPVDEDNGVTVTPPPANQNEQDTPKAPVTPPDTPGKTEDDDTPPPPPPADPDDAALDGRFVLAARNLSTAHAVAGNPCGHDISEITYQGEYGTASIVDGQLVYELNEEYRTSGTSLTTYTDYITYQDADGQYHKMEVVVMQRDNFNSSNIEANFTSKIGDGLPLVVAGDGLMKILLDNRGNTNDTVIDIDQDPSTMGDLFRRTEIFTGDGNDKVTLGAGLYLSSRVYLGEGNDTLSMGAVFDAGIVSVGNTLNTAENSGNNHVTIKGNMGNHAQFIGGSGDDTLTITGEAYRLNKASGIDMGDGDNTLTIGRVRGIRVTAGDGDDDITITGSIGSFGGADPTAYGLGPQWTEIRTGDGDDTVTVGGGVNSVGDYRNVFDLGDGNDELNLGSSLTRTNIDMGDGNDLTTIAGKVSLSSIDMGKGDDVLTLKGAIADASISAGDGDDLVIIKGAVANTGILLGDGNDTLELSQLTSGTINAGEGNDELVLHLNGQAAKGLSSAGVFKGLFDGNAEVEGFNSLILDLSGGKKDTLVLTDEMLANLAEAGTDNGNEGKLDIHINGDSTDKVTMGTGMDNWTLSQTLDDGSSVYTSSDLENVRLIIENGLL